MRVTNNTCLIVPFGFYKLNNHEQRLEIIEFLIKTHKRNTIIKWLKD